MTTKEFWKRTGITEGYGAEILKDAEHAAWHIPQGAGFVTETPEEEPTVIDEDLDDPTEPTDNTGEVGGDPIVEDDDDLKTEGGSVEGETEE
jgi:hypothetical protein